MSDPNVFHKIVRLRGKIRDKLFKFYSLGKINARDDAKLNAELKSLNDQLIEEEAEQ